MLAADETHERRPLRRSEALHRQGSLAFAALRTPTPQQQTVRRRCRCAAVGFGTQQRRRQIRRHCRVCLETALKSSASAADAEVMKVLGRRHRASLVASVALLLVSIGVAVFPACSNLFAVDVVADSRIAAAGL